MKLLPYLTKIIFSIFLIVSCVSSHLLKAENNINQDLAEMTKKLRCMTCQNQSIYDSETDFAMDIKKIIIKKLNEGQDQNEIFDFLVERYGEYILFEPRLNKKNIFLWIFPFFVFFISAVFLLIYINKNKISK
tara:strand:+ start:242 stop:640 length:399 start_codon:yes stop_codon:yes gene_type:complete